MSGDIIADVFLLTFRKTSIYFFLTFFLMDANAYVALAKGIALLAIIGPGIGIGLIGYGAMTAIGRNPSAAKEVFTPMLMAFAFAELLGLLAFLSLFLLKA